jgi:hypothetical protein
MRLFIEVSKLQIDVIGESQLVGVPTQFPSVSMMNWQDNKPNARYWVLKLIHDNFHAGDALVETSLEGTGSDDVDAQGFATPQGRKRTRSRCRKAIAMNENLVKSDKNNVQAVADLASANLTMGLALYLMHSPREALVFVQRSDSMVRSVAVRDPDPLSNGMVHAVALLYSGRIEASLHHPEFARKDLDLAQAMLEQLAKRSPKHRYIMDALGETQAAIKALPDDTASIAVH